MKILSKLTLQLLLIEESDIHQLISISHFDGKISYCLSKVSACAVVKLRCTHDFQLPTLKIELENLSSPTVSED